MGRWCNGNTAPVKVADAGSNPVRSTLSEGKYSEGRQDGEKKTGIISLEIILDPRATLADNYLDLDGVPVLASNRVAKEDQMLVVAFGPFRFCPL